MRSTHLTDVNGSLNGTGGQDAAASTRPRAGIRGASLPPLSRAEEVRLVCLIEAGVAAQAALDGKGIRSDASRVELERVRAEGKAGWDRFLLSNVRLVWSVSGPVARRSGLPEDDLFQEGFLEMARLLRCFDPSRGRFSTHVLVPIQRRIAGVAASRNGAVGLSDRQALLIRQAYAIAAQIEAEKGRPARPEEISWQIDRSPAWTARLLAYRAPVLISDFGADRSRFAASESEDDSEVRDVSRHLRHLSGTQRQVVGLRYGFVDGRTRTYQAVAEALGLSMSDARRTCLAALAVLRDALDREAETMRQHDRAGRGEGLSVEARRELSEIDRLTSKGLSLLEIAIAMKTEPRVVYEACRVGGRDDLLARLTRMELRMIGPQPSGTNVLAERIRRSSAAVPTGRTGDPPAPRAVSSSRASGVEEPGLRRRPVAVPAGPAL